MTYFDTAYIVKCYVKEDGWQQVRKLARDQERIACSVFGRLELHAALHRKMRENALAGGQFKVVLEQFRADEEERLWTWLPLTAAIMTEVAATFSNLSGDVFLRTGDAIHLLTARQNGLQEVFSNDRRLLDAAPAVGMLGRNVIRTE
ncbi:MAG: type II toxin-antitoxin system VapC family toxin [Spirochaetaceae bacterium]|nr:type II toxin-antitoxin system VapC family toxin [Spirochaetaceae bacterium]MDE0449319.1 type II toxin-antitoxin system VapC family toxin [Spirochaetaceae bacterium]